jgi:hypothetical protein
MHDAWKAAFQEWEEKKANDLCRDGQFAKACRAVNGGANGLADRQEWHAKAKKIWPVLPFDHSEKIDTKPAVASTTIQGGGAAATGGTGIVFLSADAAIVKARAAPSFLDGCVAFVSNLLLTDTGFNWVLILGILAASGGIGTIIHRFKDGDIAGIFRSKP